MSTYKGIKYKYSATGNAPSAYPTEIFFGNILFEDRNGIYIPRSYPFASKWGEISSIHILEEKELLAPCYIDIIWISLSENKFYSLEAPLPKIEIENLLSETNELTEQPIYNYIIAGMAPYGRLAIWLSGNGITTEVAWLQAEEIDVEMEDFAPNSSLSRNEYVETSFRECKEAYEHFLKHGLPDRLLFERYMQKFTYRITVEFENKDAVFEGIELYYYNGELNATNSGEHTTYAMRAKPYKIIINWSIGKTKYSGYFWTDEKRIIDIFSSFYIHNTEKEGTLIINILESNDTFRFSLQDESAIIEIPTEDIQIIVFKNKFEFFRSPNYNKPPQGWRN